MRQPYNLVYAEMQNTWQTISVLLTVILIVFAAIIWFTTSQLIDYAKEAAEESDEMRMQRLETGGLITTLTLRHP